VRALVSRDRLSGLGTVLAVIGIVLLVALIPGVATESRTFVFGLGAGAPRLDFDPRVLGAVLAGLIVAGGVVAVVVRRQAVRWIGIAVAAGAIGPLILTLAMSATDRQQTNVLPILQETFVQATPITLGAMCGLLCERVGVINIGIEGTMLGSCCVGYAVYVLINEGTGGVPLWLGIIAGVLTGMLLGLLHAWLCVTMGMDQIVAGLFVNLLALGGAGYARNELVKTGVEGVTPTSVWKIPILGDLPIVGEIFFNGKPIFYSVFFIVPIVYVVLFKTRWGLRVRASGENPWATETMGIEVRRIRYQAIVAGGALAGLGGVWFSLEASGAFREDIISGYGFIALAAVIFGKWRPFYAWGGAIVFGFAQVIGSRLQILEVSVAGYPFPSEAGQVVPYLVTMLVVAGIVGRSRGPAATGRAFSRTR
jgi:ABC-type uncharacterized transport system permease subunit